MFNKKNKGTSYIGFLTIILLIIGISVIALMIFMSYHKDVEISKIDSRIEHLSESEHYDLERADIINRIQLVKKDVADSQLNIKEESPKYLKYKQDLELLETKLANQDREHDRKIAKQVETK